MLIINVCKLNKEEIPERKRGEKNSQLSMMGAWPLFSISATKWLEIFFPHVRFSSNPSKCSFKFPNRENLKEDEHLEYHTKLTKEDIINTSD